RALLERGRAAASERGEFIYLVFNWHRLTASGLVCGDPLADVQREIEAGLAFVRNARFPILVDCFAAHLYLVAAMRGLPLDYPSFEQVDEASTERHFRERPEFALGAAIYWMRKLQAKVFLRDEAAALACAKESERLSPIIAPHFEIAEHVFYSALAFAAAGERESAVAQRDKLAAWNEYGPKTFAGRLALVDAELARRDGRNLDAERAYHSAIELCRRDDFVQQEGLACELAARFYDELELGSIASEHRRRARTCFKRWGADGKVAALDARYP